MFELIVLFPVCVLKRIFDQLGIELIAAGTANVNLSPFDLYEYSQRDNRLEVRIVSSALEKVQN